MLAKFKSQIEEIENGCCEYYGEDNEMICIGNSDIHIHVLCPTCKAKLQATLKTKRETCEDELRFLNEEVKSTKEQDEVQEEGAFQVSQTNLFLNIEDRIAELQQVIDYCKEKER